MVRVIGFGSEYPAAQQQQLSTGAQIDGELTQNKYNSEVRQKDPDNSGAQQKNLSTVNV